MTKTKKQKKIARHKRVRAKIIGTTKRPRVSVFKSNKHFYIQLVDDSIGKTLASVSDREIKSKKNKAGDLGKLLAKKAFDMGIKVVVFDRAGYKYHGAVSSIASGAREGGLKF